MQTIEIRLSSSLITERNQRKMTNNIMQKVATLLENTIAHRTILLFSVPDLKVRGQVDILLGPGAVDMKNRKTYVPRRAVIRFKCSDFSETNNTHNNSAFVI